MKRKLRIILFVPSPLSSTYNGATFPTSIKLAPVLGPPLFAASALPRTLIRPRIATIETFNVFGGELLRRLTPKRLHIRYFLRETLVTMPET
jgi:hypothetical protein